LRELLHSSATLSAAYVAVQFRLPDGVDRQMLKTSAEELGLLAADGCEGSESISIAVSCEVQVPGCHGDGCGASAWARPTPSYRSGRWSAGADGSCRTVEGDLVAFIDTARRRSAPQHGRDAILASHDRSV